MSAKLTGFTTLWIVLSLGVLAGCGGSSGEGGDGSGPIKIAVVQPYTGDSSYYGEAADNAMALAIEDHGGRVAGRSVELVRGDSKCEPAAAVQAAHQVLSKRPAAVLLPECSGDTLAMKPLLKSRQVPGCSNNLAPNIIEPGDKYIWRAEPGDGVINPLFAKYIAEQGVKRIGIIHDTTAYGQTNAETIKRGLEENNVEVVAEATYEFGDTDYSGQILKLKRVGVDAAYMSGYQLQIGNLIKQARELGLDVPLYVNEDALGAVTIKAAGAAMDTDVSIATTWLPAAVPEAIEFDRTWQAKYGEAATVPVVGLYECARALLKALEAAGPGASGEEVDRAISEVDLKKMPSGRVAFDSSRERRDPPVIIGRVRNGKQVLVKVLSGEEWFAASER